MLGAMNRTRMWQPAGDPLYIGRRSNGDGGWRKFVEVSMQMRYDAVRVRYVMLCNARVVLIQRR